MLKKYLLALRLNNSKLINKIKSGIPFYWNRGEYSIGIYKGPNLLELKPISTNPVIKASDVTDRKASFVADPFMIKHLNKWYMFFEVLEDKSNKGLIGLATSLDGLAWKYCSIVLEEPFHLSYPEVFICDKQIYMLPESHEQGVVMLYKANPFPKKWEPINKIVDGIFVDSTVFFYNGFWWMFTTAKAGMVNLFYTKNIEGQWREHPKSPFMKGNQKLSRPAGRVLMNSDNPYRVAQNDSDDYGKVVYIFKITKLDLKSYEEVSISNNPILRGTGTGWNSQRMHHLDAHEIDNGSIIACVDGWNRKIAFGLKNKHNNKKQKY